MSRLFFTPEAVASFRRLPATVQRRFDRVLVEIDSTPRVRLPGSYSVHQLEGGRDLWTLRIGGYRGIFRWDGHEARFIRFGPRATVYQRLPK
jgi:mRNA-degrading endonuclease RelE of RelBE toxin-antitoxin system